MLDVYGGTAIGVIIVTVFWRIRHIFADSIHTTACLPLKLLCGVVFTLLACPQPRPLTPSFYMSAAHAGMIAGLIMGVTWLRANLIRQNTAGLLSSLNGSLLGVLSRNLVAVALVVGLRTITKSLLIAAFRASGVEAYGKNTKDSQNTSHRGELYISDYLRCNYEHSQSFAYGFMKCKRKFKPQISAFANHSHCPDMHGRTHTHEHIIYAHATPSKPDLFTYMQSVLFHVYLTLRVTNGRRLVIWTREAYISHFGGEARDLRCNAVCCNGHCPLVTATPGRCIW